MNEPKLSFALFLFVCLWAASAMHSGTTPEGLQGINGVAVIKPTSPRCKSNALPPVLSFYPLLHRFLCFCLGVWRDNIVGRALVGMQLN